MNSGQHKRYFRTKILFTMIALGLSLSFAQAQDSLASASPRRLNTLRLNLDVGYLWSNHLYNDFSQRGSFEYGRTFAKHPRLEMVGDFEFLKYEETPLIEVRPGYWDAPVIYQKRYAILAGLRYHFFYFPARNRRPTIWLEPQLGASYNTFIMYMTAGSPGITAEWFMPESRLKVGITLPFCKRWSLAASLEAYRKYFRYTDRNVISFISEINIGFLF